MKAYVLTENDMTRLRDLIEKWEAQSRVDFPSARISNMPEGVILGRVRYSLFNWISDVSK